MDFAFTDEQQAIRELARRILGDRATHERLKEIEAGREGWDRNLWREMGTANLLGLAIPEEHGGSGMSFLELCVVIEEAGRAAAPLPLAPALVWAALPIVRHGTDEQRARLLPGVCAGETVLTAALPGLDRADPAASAAFVAERDGDGLVVRGEADLVPVADAAERVLVLARAEGGVVALLLDPRADGVTLERQVTTTTRPAFRVRADGARVEARDVIPAADAGSILDHALAALCIHQAGACEQALRLTASYLSEREQFGRPLGSFQAVQQRAADAYVDVEAMRWTAWRAAWLLAEGRPAVEEVAVAKIWAAEAGQRVVSAAQHLHGGIGVDIDYPLWRYTVLAKEAELLLGGGTPHLARLGDLVAEGAR